MTVHHMQESLLVAKAWAAAPWWERVYRDAFPSFEGMVAIDNNGSGQRDGIDRQIVLTNGRTIAVDEKVRQIDYDDFCLEYWSVYPKNGTGEKVRGWIAKDLRSDYVAYAFAASGRCYLLPFQQLRAAWGEHGRQWVRACRRVEADNGRYLTVSVAVPIQMVLDAVRDVMLIRFEPDL
jgi:hypothetical protein